MTLKFKKVLTIVLFTAQMTIADKKCNGINFDEKYYEIIPIMEDINNVTQVIYNKFDDTVYFKYDLLNNIDNHGIGYVNLETKEVGTINGVKKATSIAVDVYNGFVYIGGSDGIFKLDANKVPNKLRSADESIAKVYLRNGLYFINSHKEAYEYVRGMATKVPELIDFGVSDIIIDDDRNIFFLEEKHLFRIKIGTRAVNTHEQYSVNCMANDIHNKVYFCTNDGIYRYNKFNFNLNKVSGLNNVKGLTFNKNNDPIISYFNGIYKLNLRSIAC